ncbi:MAG: redoxin family protein [Neomegalonema sp.]|nr:redoxin family protein [Neomegalonema sp.]
MTVWLRNAARLALASLIVAVGAATALAAPEVGSPAPAFVGAGSKGEAVDLTALKGKRVVLEWTNHDCPFVRKHYSGGNMQSLQKRAAEAGVVWISIISSAPGRQGHVSADRANELTVTRKAAPAHVVLDPSGKIGRLYGARTTPHMFVIDEKGALVFKGGIDSIPSANPADIKSATNYVAAALDALAAGGLPKVASARPYGCSVKYGS